MAKITEIEFPAGVGTCYGNVKRASLNPAARLCSSASYQLTFSENGNVNIPVAAFISGVPGGYRNNNGTFNNIGNNCNCWSSTENSTTNAWNRNLNYNNSNINRNNNNKRTGFSVRCVRDLKGNDTASAGDLLSEAVILNFK